MPITLSEAKAHLLKGTPLSWKKFENHKAGSVVLETADARRLFEFLSDRFHQKLRKLTRSCSWPTAGVDSN